MKKIILALLTGFLCSSAWPNQNSVVLQFKTNTFTLEKMYYPFIINMDVYGPNGSNAYPAHMTLAAQQDKNNPQVCQVVCKRTASSYSGRTDAGQEDALCRIFKTQAEKYPDYRTVYNTIAKCSIDPTKKEDNVVWPFYDEIAKAGGAKSYAVQDDGDPRKTQEPMRMQVIS